MVHFHYGREKITIERKERSITIIIEAVSPGNFSEIFNFFLIKNFEFNKYFFPLIRHFCRENSQSQKGMMSSMTAMLENSRRMSRLQSNGHNPSYSTIKYHRDKVITSINDASDTNL